MRLSMKSRKAVEDLDEAGIGNRDTEFQKLTI